MTVRNLGFSASREFDPVLAAGTEAYVRYCAGLAVVQSPYETVQIHNQPEVDANVDEILAVGAHMMFRSVKRLIQAVHGTDNPKEARYSFEENEPHLYEVVDHACETAGERLAQINVWYPVLRPAPFLDRTVYSHITTSRYERLKLPKLMDDMPPHKLFENSSMYVERPRAS